MRKLLGSILVAILLAALVVGVTGCGAKETGEILTPAGSVDIERDGNKIKVTRNGVTRTWTAETADEKAIGFPLPQNAELVRGTALRVVGPGSERWIGGSFFVNEATDAVISFYREELSEMEGFTDTSKEINGEMTGLFSVSAGSEIKSVIIKPSEHGEEARTWLQISTASNTKV